MEFEEKQMERHPTKDNSKFENVTADNVTKQESLSVGRVLAACVDHSGVTTRCYYQRGEGVVPEMNRFEQVSNDGH